MRKCTLEKSLCALRSVFVRIHTLSIHKHIIYTQKTIYKNERLRWVNVGKVLVLAEPARLPSQVINKEVQVALHCTQMALAGEFGEVEELRQFDQQSSQVHSAVNLRVGSRIFTVFVHLNVWHKFPLLDARQHLTPSTNKSWHVGN